MPSDRGVQNVSEHGIVLELRRVTVRVGRCLYAYTVQLFSFHEVVRVCTWVGRAPRVPATEL